MGLLKIVLLGRPNGIRRRIFSKLWSETEDTSPFSSYSAPNSTPYVEPTAVQTPGSTQSSDPLAPPKTVTPPEGFEVVLHKDALQDGQIAEIIIAGTAIAVALSKGTFYAFSNTCPHAGGPLSEGTLEVGEEHVWVRCPYHGWDFDLKNGACLTSSQFDVGCYETIVIDNAVCVKL